MLADSFNVKRRTETMNNYGESSVTSVTTSGVCGVITQADPQDLMRRDDGQMASRGISIVTPYHLRSAAAGFQPDIVVWAGEEYTVKRCEPYHRFGTGFFEAVAEAMSAQVQPF